MAEIVIKEERNEFEDHQHELPENNNTIAMAMTAKNLREVSKK